MKDNSEIEKYWNACPECFGEGQKSRKFTKKRTRNLLNKLEEQEKKENGKIIPGRINKHRVNCESCNATGLIESDSFLEPNENLPHVSIIGGGIGGTALAIACLHRGIPFTIYERDESFDSRSQGYGLTLQQASKAMQGLGIPSLEGGIISTKHLVHNPEGKVIAEWGMREWLKANNKKHTKRQNIHIPRQSLRQQLINQLGGNSVIQWNHQLLDYSELPDKTIELTFKANGQSKQTKTDLVVGADGIRSTVRKQLIGESTTPLNYLNCIVILGICPLENLNNIESPLLDGETVFQTANGIERMYMMPFTEDSVMWQFSYPIEEEAAKELSSKGPKALKEDALKRAQWHFPVPEIIKATKEELISGYPAYDRQLIESEMLTGNAVTLIGDAAHPMSPFKGQGANQAILDALVLAKAISKGCKTNSNWKEIGLKDAVLNEFESEMAYRTSSKVIGSREAAKHLHSEEVLKEVNEPRGRHLKG